MSPPQPHAPSSPPSNPTPFTPTKPSSPAPSLSSSTPGRRPATNRELRETRKASFAETSTNIYNAHLPVNNIHKEELPKYVPQATADLVEFCYLEKGQPGWIPLQNVDPGYDYEKDHPSFKYWYEHSSSFNADGVAAHKGSPRLYNYDKRNKSHTAPTAADTTRGGLEGRTQSSVISRRNKDASHPNLKITEIDGIIGRENYRNHITMGNGLVRWTDSVFNWESREVNSKDLNDQGKSLWIYPKELEPMYSSFSGDKIFRYVDPRKAAKKKKKKRIDPKMIVAQCEARRALVAVRGRLEGSKPSPRFDEDEGGGDFEEDGRERTVKTEHTFYDSVTGEAIVRTPRAEDAVKPPKPKQPQTAQDDSDVVEVVSITSKVSGVPSIQGSLASKTSVSVRSGGFNRTGGAAKQVVLTPRKLVVSVPVVQKQVVAVELSASAVVIDGSGAATAEDGDSDGKPAVVGAVEMEDAAIKDDVSETSFGSFQSRESVNMMDDDDDDGDEGCDSEGGKRAFDDRRSSTMAVYGSAKK
jgi:hypothetical protein